MKSTVQPRQDQSHDAASGDLHGVPGGTSRVFGERAERELTWSRSEDLTLQPRISPLASLRGQSLPRPLRRRSKVRQRRATLSMRSWSSLRTLALTESRPRPWGSTIQSLRVVSTCLAERDYLTVPDRLTQRLRRSRVQDRVRWNGGSAVSLSRLCGKGNHCSNSVIRRAKVTYSRCTL